MNFETEAIGVGPWGNRDGYGSSALTQKILKLAFQLNSATYCEG
jgi:hypothetical protein